MVEGFLRRFPETPQERLVSVRSGSGQHIRFPYYFSNNEFRLIRLIILGVGTAIQIPWHTTAPRD
jgi:hypothetical protein